MIIFENRLQMFLNFNSGVNSPFYYCFYTRNEKAGPAGKPERESCGRKIRFYFLAVLVIIDHTIFSEGI
jgi:hypothetical protein